MDSGSRFMSIRTRRATRRGALLLVAVWATFWLSQVLVARCDPAGGQLYRSIESFGESHTVAACARIESGNSQEAPCTPALDETAPPAGPQAGPFRNGKAPQFFALPDQTTLPALPAWRWVGNDWLPVSVAPPGRLYLRLQRFLI